MVVPKKWHAHSWDPKDKCQEKAILELNKKNDFGSFDLEKEYFDWRYRRNPAGRAIIKLAVANGNRNEIVGIYCVIPIFLICKRATIRVCMSVGTLTDVSCRGQGIFTSLARDVYEVCSKQQMHAVLGYPNQNSYKGFIRHLGFKDIGEIPLLVRPLRLSNAFKRRFRKRKWMSFAGVLERPFDLWFDVPKIDAPGIEEVRHFDQAFDELNEHLSTRFPIFVKRDSAFLNWRYFDNPFNYRVFAVREAGKILGYIIYRFVHFGKIRCGIILDFTIRRDINSFEVGCLLIRAALHDMLQNECEISGAICLRNSLEFKSLKKAMFFNCPDLLKPQPIPYIIRKNETFFEPGTNLFDIVNWFVSIGDYDAA